MKKTFIICFLLSFSVQYLFAQATQAEKNKLMKQAEEKMKQYAADTARAKMMKDLLEMQKQITDAMNKQGNNNGATNALYTSDPGSYGNVDNWKFPPKKISLLASIPKKVFTKSELVSFLNDTYLQLSKKIPAGISSSVQKIATKYNNDGNKMGDIAVAGWYTNYREEALLLIIKAAINSPDNGMLLNNCAALLNMSGIEQTAIPILKYALQSYPGSSMLLNNLGQAYAALGETDTAMVYLGRSIKIEPENSEANNTAGQIEAIKGNKQKAIDYLEKSLKVAYSKPAWLKLSRIKKDANLVPLIRPRVKIPEYFNLFKYDLPAQCTRVENASIAAAENEIFRKMLRLQAKAYETKLKGMDIELIYRSSVTGRRIQPDEFIAQPYHELCGIMVRDIGAEYGNAVVNLLTKVDKKYYEARSILENEYDSLLKALVKGFSKMEDKCCGEGMTTSCCPTREEKCTAYNNLANQYLPKFAILTEEWQQKNILVHKQYFDEVIYWNYLSLRPLSDDIFKIRFYELIGGYLFSLERICITKIIEPCEFSPTTATKESNTIPEYECPLEIEIPFIVGKFELNCEKFSFKAGEGAIFGYEKNFQTKQSTVSVGIGLKLELEAKLGPLKAGVSASAGESMFITFDGDNKFSDGGLKVEAKASAGLEAEAGKAVKGKKDLAKEETGVGVTFGINSGCNFNEGPFKGMIGPKPEVPLNKKVPVYKPKQG